MDYAFTTMTDDYGKALKQMFTNKASTTLVENTAAITCFKEFIDHLKANTAVTKPIGNILLGTHARGYDMVIPVVPYQKENTSFERLLDCMFPSIIGPYIDVPDSIINYDQYTPKINNTLHIKGCNIGKSPVFLRKLKEAIGDNMYITAPLHFHTINPPLHGGTFETMTYEFRVLRATPFSNRTDYINELNSKGFTFYNGDPVTIQDWKKWVPKNIKESSKSLKYYKLGISIGKAKTLHEFLFYEYESLIRKIPITTYATADDIPVSDSDRMIELSDFLETYKYRSGDPQRAFDSAHPFPEYIRQGYASKQDFIDGHDWKFSVNGNILMCNGSYHDYTLCVPILDRTTGNIRFNFYPNAGSGLTAITTDYVESDTNFFTTV